ncbi:Glucan endo-1,3-beta-glucosidase 11 [Arabidopsis thaliana]|jgi:exo-beta-1,3-glucanase (GH17 family)|uniref:Glucan endo-1,3-beta-glucosidase 11 n=4 Tax=Arabidopsis TaxID=3701 RepID=E1311_ARATH|nr:Glycosyl hydrolase superfamily protein [Arabidopsis thaliana]Q8L868.1 RecName: Full=Glucan endo-1,3-beta-glucosidase 11; AltName: Full=(1->3)-beta-glucan endohydrolase 11; Short=(1->3)-beta-glucanase 11; AltName: Full=Beta-1,3-endoglucanase 11; Short=Beta-1,3-glucanase 11; Flags: Precursor [Arabidopsis thaliana]KAG7648301.1 Glycoside hydrolase family 17 [Arabidopsis thaliana x Arabidopsis arenosa]KAG7656223.1 Glycoside hydrolase family 17 [Arabidopsis suecica]AAM53268.1 putative beta-1,3-glu|eukprot:NP_174563.2 Glycosyl hydrolase superfamily protein [Arabidopsis thaliana]
MELTSFHRSSLLFLISLTLIILPTTTTSIGVNYGQIGDNLPSPTDVIPLIKSIGATKVKLYDANPQILKAFSNTGIEFIIGLGNEYLSKMKDPSKALTWIKQNVTPFLPATNITCITIGNEILALNDSSLTTNLLPAMQGVHSALITAGLSDQISVTTAHSLSILKSSFPPSAGEFQPDLLDSLTPILEFHRKTDSPFLINAYPFFAYKGNPKEVPLDFVLFQPNQGIVDPATGFHYDNMLFAQIDAVYSALAAAGFKSLRVEISETGWPSKGDDDEVGATPENAKRYNGNLIKMMMSGKKTKTPLKPNNDLSIYVFALFNENLKPGPTSERNYGLFKPDGTQAYSLGFALNDVVRGASGGGTGGGNSSSGGGRDKSPVFPVSPVAPDSASTGYLAISASPVTGKRKGKGAILSLVVSMLLARHLL